MRLPAILYTLIYNIIALLSVLTTIDVPQNCLGLSRALPVVTKNLKLPSAFCPTLNTVTLSAALQPKSITGPIFLFGCTPIVAPVSSLEIEHAAVPQCQNVMVFSLSSRDTGSPKIPPAQIISFQYT